MKFQKVRLDWKAKGIKMDYGWLLVIDNIEDLIIYHKKVMSNQIPLAWDNLLKVQDGKAHISTSLGQIISLQSDGMEKKSLLELTAIVSDKIFQAKELAIIKSGKVYIGSNGGCFPHSDDLVILDERDVLDKNIIFPDYTEKDITVKKWPEGKHWYAYVGPFWVEIDGKNKWNKEETAWAMARIYLFRIKREHYKLKEDQ